MRWTLLSKNVATSAIVLLLSSTTSNNCAVDGKETRDDFITILPDFPDDGSGDVVDEDVGASDGDDEQYSSYYYSSYDYSSLKESYSTLIQYSSYDSYSSEDYSSQYSAYSSEEKEEEEEEEEDDDGESDGDHWGGIDPTACFQSGCNASLLENHECDQTCNTTACNFDLGLCAAFGVDIIIPDSDPEFPENKFSIRFLADFDELAPKLDKYRVYIRGVIADAAGVDESQVEILSIVKGSVIVTFQIYSSEEIDEDELKEDINEIIEANDPFVVGDVNEITRQGNDDSSSSTTIIIASICAIIGVILIALCVTFRERIRSCFGCSKEPTTVTKLTAGEAETDNGSENRRNDSVDLMEADQVVVQV